MHPSQLARRGERESWLPSNHEHTCTALSWRHKRQSQTRPPDQRIALFPITQHCRSFSYCGLRRPLLDNPMGPALSISLVMCQACWPGSMTFCAGVIAICNAIACRNHLASVLGTEMDGYYCNRCHPTGNLIHNAALVAVTESQPWPSDPVLPVPRVSGPRHSIVGVPCLYKSTWSPRDCRRRQSHGQNLEIATLWQIIGEAIWTVRLANNSYDGVNTTCLAVAIQVLRHERG